jgi:hypothetical protein
VPVQQSRSASVQEEAGGALRTILDDPRPASGKSASTVDYREGDAGQVLVSTAEGLDGSGKDDAEAGRGGSNRAAVGMDRGAAEPEGMVPATAEKTMTQQQKGLADTPQRKDVGMAGSRRAGRKQTRARQAQRCSQTARASPSQGPCAI